MCRDQFGHFANIQAELDAQNPELGITLLGVNNVGATQGINSLSSSITLPLVQDTDSSNVWSSWDVTQRDVWILDGENMPYAVMNLSIYSLTTPSNFHSLKALLKGAAEGTPCADITLNLEAQGQPASNVDICQ